MDSIPNGFTQLLTTVGLQGVTFRQMLLIPIRTASPKVHIIRLFRQASKASIVKQDGTEVNHLKAAPGPAIAWSKATSRFKSFPEPVPLLV
jgi:hypothetical protein